MAPWRGQDQERQRLARTAHCVPSGTLSGPYVPCVGPAPATWFVSVLVKSHVNEHAEMQAGYCALLSEKRNELIRAPLLVLIQVLPVIVVRGACAGVRHA